MTDNMVERVARAMLRHMEKSGNDLYSGTDYWQEEFNGFPEKVLSELAHAAIEAMREPTEAMTYVGLRIPVTDRWERKSERVGTLIGPVSDGPACWQAMIDKALKEK